MRAGIYGRESKGETKSIEDQLELGEEAVVEKQWTLAGRYRDYSSASLFRQKEREHWARLLADLTAGLLDVVVLWKVARGSRDEIDWFPLLRTCAERGVLIHVLADDRTYDPSDDRDWKSLADEGIAASYYSRQLSKDVRRGVTKAAAKGRPHGRCPFGYERSYDEKRRPLQAPGEHAWIVKEIFERLDQLTPINALMADFRARNLPSPSGLPWARNTIRVIATNVSYIGIRRTSEGDHAAGWPAIVDEGVFWRVQRLLGAPERKTTKPGKARHLLSWIGEAPCGGRLGRIPGKPSKANPNPYRYACNLDGCVSILQNEADAAVTRAVLARLARADVRALLDTDDAAARQAAVEIARYEAQLEEARASFDSPDGISAEALARKERVLLPLIEEARKRSRPEGAAGALRDLLAAPDRAAHWASLEIAAQRGVIAALATIRLGPPTRSFGHSASPETRLAEAAARLGGSFWVGDDTRTWAQIAADAGVVATTVRE